MAVVEDGGEISAVSNVSVDVALAAGDEPLSRRFGFRLTEFPVGVATSSGRFSHALSFGDAEAATVFCGNAGLADAAATAVGNVVKGENPQGAIQHGIDRAQSIQGVNGVLILYRGFVGTAGKIPQIIRVDPEALIVLLLGLCNFCLVVVGGFARAQLLLGVCVVCCFLV